MASENGNSEKPTEEKSKGKKKPKETKREAASPTKRKAAVLAVLEEDIQENNKKRKIAASAAPTASVDVDPVSTATAAEKTQEEKYPLVVSLKAEAKEEKRASVQKTPFQKMECMTCVLLGHVREQVLCFADKTDEIFKTNKKHRVAQAAACTHQDEKSARRAKNQLDLDFAAKAVRIADLVMDLSALLDAREQRNMVFLCKAQETLKENMQDAAFAVLTWKDDMLRIVDFFVDQALLVASQEKNPF